MSQRALAEAAGIDFTYLSKVENSRMDPPSEGVIRTMAGILETNADELVALAGKVPADLSRTLAERPDVIRFLRSVEGEMRSGAEWPDIIRRAKSEEI